MAKLFEDIRKQIPANPPAAARDRVAKLLLEMPVNVQRLRKREKSSVPTE